MDNIKPEKVLDLVLAGQIPENYEIDWTSGVKNLDSLGEKIASFATSGGGWLIIGLNDEHPPKVIGIDNEQVVITNMGNVLRNCDPIPTTSNPKFIERQGGKIAIYKITGLGGNICSYKDIPYHRVQDSAKKMTQNNFREFFNRRNMLTWEQRPSPATKKDIDRNELLFYMKKAAERNSLNPQTEENFLKSNKAIMEEGDQLTNLGTIVLVDNPSYFLPQCKIQLVRFRGDKPIDRIAAILISTTARKLLDNCINFLKLNLPVRTWYQGSDRFEEPIIPELVLREIVVNMIVHRDYSDPQESLIRIFDDRVEFQNPGAPTPEELEKILSQGIPTHRNQWIYNFLRPIHKAEAAGQGIPIIKREMMRRGLEEPKITILANVFHLGLKFAERKPETLGDIILLYGRERGILSTSDVMRVHKISRPTAIRILNELVAKGLAKHYGERRGSTYHFK